MGLLPYAFPPWIQAGYRWGWESACWLCDCLRCWVAATAGFRKRSTVGWPCVYFFVLLVAKMLALSLTVSSGGSGGVFAPSLFVGSMLGGVFAGIFHHPPADLVIVGMAAVFGGAAASRLRRC